MDSKTSIYRILRQVIIVFPEEVRELHIPHIGATGLTICSTSTSDTADCTHGKKVKPSGSVRKFRFDRFNESY